MRGDLTGTPIITEFVFAVLILITVVNSKLIMHEFDA